MVRQLPISPKASSRAVSRVMAANKAKNTKPELELRKFLLNNGFRGYRINWKKAHGRPDVCYPGKKLAIFVHGCFWHRCPKCTKGLPKSNSEFWKRKFELNVLRDSAKKTLLELQGWKVLELWECEISNGNFSRVIRFLATILLSKEKTT
jgi:DNA mismatch endonuclease (patch repair protein)